METKITHHFLLFVLLQTAAITAICAQSQEARQEQVYKTEQATGTINKYFDDYWNVSNNPTLKSNSDKIKNQLLQFYSSINAQQQKEILTIFYNDIESALEKDDQALSIKLVNKYLLIAPETDENKGSLLNVLGFLYANANERKKLQATIDDLQTYASLTKQNLNADIQKLREQYAKLPVLFDEEIEGYWVSSKSSGKANTPYVLIHIEKNINNKFANNSLKIDENSGVFFWKTDFSMWGVEETKLTDEKFKKAMNCSQSFYLDGNLKKMGAIIGSEKLNAGSEFLAQSGFEFTKSLQESIAAMSQSNSFGKQVAGNVSSAAVGGILNNLFLDASISKKAVTIWSLDFNQYEERKLRGSFQKDCFVSYSIHSNLFTKKENENLNLIKIDTNRGYIFASSEGKPMFTGNISENMYKHSALYNINKQYSFWKPKYSIPYFGSMLLGAAVLGFGVYKVVEIADTQGADMPFLPTFGYATLGLTGMIVGNIIIPMNLDGKRSDKRKVALSNYNKTVYDDLLNQK